MAIGENNCCHDIKEATGQMGRNVATKEIILPRDPNQEEVMGINISLRLEVVQYLSVPFPQFGYTDNVLNLSY